MNRLIDLALDALILRNPILHWVVRRLTEAQFGLLPMEEVPDVAS